MPDLAQALPCFYSTDHANLMGYMSGKECSPFEIFDLFIPNASPSDIGKDMCDYEAMITHALKQSDADECDCNAMNHHADPHNCDPMYMKKNKSNMMI